MLRRLSINRFNALSQVLRSSLSRMHATQINPSTMVISMQKPEQKLAAHVLLLNDYVWDKTVSPAWTLPSRCAHPPVLHIGDGLNWLQMQDRILSSEQQEFLSDENINSLKKQINSEIPPDSVCILSAGFADCVHDKLVQTAKDRGTILVSSTLNVIPLLKGRTLIVTYDAHLLHRYMAIKEAGKQRFKEHIQNIAFLGFEHVDKEYQDAINTSCNISRESHDLFLSKIVAEIERQVRQSPQKIENIVIECTTIMQIVPMLQKLDLNVNVIGITEAIELMIQHKFKNLI